VSAAAGLRILAFCDYFSEHSSGGSERAALEIYRRLAHDGATIRVITPLPRSMPAVASNGRLEVRAVPTLDLSQFLGIQAALPPSLFAGLRQTAAEFRPSVIHANTLFFGSTLAAARLQQVTGVPLVTTVQIAGLDLLPWPARLPGMAYERTVGRFVLSRSTWLIAVSPAVRAHLVELGAPDARISVIPNGVDLERFYPAVNVKQGPRVVMFVGRLISNKGPDTFLRALLQLRSEGSSFKAVFVGDGPMRAQLEEQAKSLGPSVEFAGQIPDVAPLLRQADILVRPSLTEGLPLGILEAMASGVSVIASDIAGNRDLIRHGDNGLLVPPNDSSALAQAIRALLEDTSRRKKLAGSAMQTVGQYGWDSIASRTGAMLASVANVGAGSLRRAS
jgi:1,4-alpha-glucan branching enzyme